MNQRRYSRCALGWFAKAAIAVAVLLLALPTACRANPGAADAAEVHSIKGFPEATLTIFPVTLFWTGRWERDEARRVWAAAYKQGFCEDKASPLAHTLGLLLAEEGGGEFAVADAEFDFPREKAAREKRARAFGRFVRKLDLKTDYALCVEFIHTGRRSGICEEIYTVMVDPKGHVAWEDTLKERAGTEMRAIEAVCARLAPAMGLDTLPKRELTEDEQRKLQEIRAKEPPTGAEFAAMDKQRAAMKQAGASARVLVYPARIGGDHTDPACAAHLAGLLAEAGLVQATAAEAGPTIEGSGWPNEMQVLWLFARNVRDYVQAHPADTDYVLFADYWFNPSGQVWAVHFVVCDRTGAWVIADLQNAHQEDFQRISPKDIKDCDRLVCERLATELH